MTYEYNGVDIAAPAKATLYTYVLYDAEGKILEKSAGQEKIPANGKVSISIGGLDAKSGRIVINWYEEVSAEDTNGDGTPDGEPTIKKLETVYEKDVRFTEEA